MGRKLTPHERLCRAMKEEELSEAIVQYAEGQGWRVFFIPDWVWRIIFAGMRAKPRKGRRWSKPGFPDLVMAKPGRLVCAELKAELKDPREDQIVWLDLLATVPGVETYLWKPSHWLDGQVDRTLAIE